MIVGLQDLQSQISAPAAYKAALALDLGVFTRFVFTVVRPGAVFRPNWHIDAVTHKLAQVARGEVRRLIITLPPRNLKSIAASVALPAYFLGRNPSERVAVTSYSDTLARTHANDFRVVVNHPYYQAAFSSMRLSRDTDREIVTTKRGSVLPLRSTVHSRVWAATSSLSMIRLSRATPTQKPYAEAS